MKLIKRHSLGGIAESVDTLLDKLGPWGKLGVQVVDPTGITGWKDFSDSLTEFLNTGTLVSAAGLGLAALGAMPIIGGFGRASKVAKAADKVSDTSKIISKGKRLFDSDIYKRLIDPNDSNIDVMVRAFSGKQIAEANRILDNEIAKVYNWVLSKGLKEIPAKMKDKIAKLEYKKSILLEARPNPAYNKMITAERRIKSLEDELPKFIGTPRERSIRTEIEKLNKLLKVYSNIQEGVWNSMKQQLI